MTYLDRTVGDPLAFFHVQVICPIQKRKINLVVPGFWRYLKMLFTVQPLRSAVFNHLPRICNRSSISSHYNLLFYQTSPLLRRFNFLAYLTPTLTGSFTSLPRYVLLCFPLVPACWRSVSSFFTSSRKIILGTFVLAFIIFLGLFAREILGGMKKTLFLRGNQILRGTSIFNWKRRS